MPDPFYITTAISYPNGRPHVGHAYEAIATDAIARWRRLAGHEVFFMTGTDEHGLKMAQAARERGISPKALADEMSSQFKAMDEFLNISFDRFIRTTEAAHHTASQALWRAMSANGDVYLGRYEGWYSVRDEAFYGEEELRPGEDGAKLSPQGTPVEWTVEESWFFRLSAYRDRLLALYESRPDFIQPESRRNEVLSFVRGGLSDLSISRTSFDWGVPVPDSPGHVMYVWVDALTNYLTGVGYPGNSEEWQRFWPADLHIIGKDIVRFHAVYWPAFLMSAGLPPPKTVFGHGFLLNRGEKMSKSVGNVVDPIAMAERVGVDALRYFLLSEVQFGSDGSFTLEAMAEQANAHLSNAYGNLLQRIIAFVARRLEGRAPRLATSGRLPQDGELAAALAKGCQWYDDAMRALDLAAGARACLAMAFACNKYVDETAPWSAIKSDPEAGEHALAQMVVALVEISLRFQPFIPTGAGAALDVLQYPAELRGSYAGDVAAWYREAQPTLHYSAPQPIFPRIDLAA